MVAVFLLAKNYDPLKFNKVPHFNHQVPILETLKMEHILKKIGPIYRKYRVCNDFGLVVAHRHFRLEEDEILVDTEKHDGSISAALPWKYNAVRNTVEGPKNLGYFESKGLSVPKEGSFFIEAITWDWSNPTGSLSPFEFRISSCINPLPRPPGEFVAELYETLKELGVQQLFALRRNTGGTFWETTDYEARANISTNGNISIPKELAPFMKMVYWTFTEEGGGKDTVNGVCVGHCHHIPVVLMGVDPVVGASNPL